MEIVVGVEAELGHISQRSCKIDQHLLDHFGLLGFSTGAAPSGVRILRVQRVEVEIRKLRIVLQVLLLLVMHIDGLHGLRDCSR